jgi:glycerol-3-phosphate O-acyltransferase
VQFGSASASQPPIFGFNQARGAIVDEVVRRVCEGVRDPLLALNEAAFLEVRRQEAGGDDDVVHLGEWRALARSLGRMSDDERRAKTRDLAGRYARDVAGNFDPRVYKFASRAVAPLIGMVLSPSQTVRHLGGAFDLRALDGRVVIEGPVGRIRALAEKGTLVFVPTHLSNLDSVVFGFALERAGLPPATYGAGKNLFTNRVLSFFMHNLGAYRVDRRIRHGLYKEVLKAYSCVLLERGYHSLFFPGGTRSRSGAVERHLKLGLMGTAVEAMARTAAGGAARHVFFVPATINYLLTLEAETLVDDFLQEEGKHRYIIEDDESSRAIRIASFLRKLLGLDAACVIRFGRPLDCFGNEVDDEAVSRDGRGHPIDRISYLTDADGRVRPDPARDAEYTRELGQAVVAAYRRDTVVMATHLVAACAFARLFEATLEPKQAKQAKQAKQEGHPSGAGAPKPGAHDIFALLRRRDDVTVARSELAAAVERLRDRAQEMETQGRLVLRPHLARATGREILDEALRAFSGYYTTPVLEPRGADLVLVDTRLIFYYQNRLAAHGLAADLARDDLHDFTGNPARFALGSRASSP